METTSDVLLKNQTTLEKRRAYAREYYKQHKEQLNIAACIKKRERYQTDPEFRERVNETTRRCRLKRSETFKNPIS